MRQDNWSETATMAVAVFLCLLLRRKLATVTLLVTTTLICFSRIYLGVHFPGDVLSGTCLGIVIGSIFYILICRFMGHGKAVVVEDKHSLVPLSLITTVAIIAVISACGVSL